MEWVLQSPQIHSTFSNLGYAHSEGYHINETCNAALETILQNILTEDKYLRNYRRNISFGQNIKKDLIPLLIHAKEDRSIELLIQIFVNLTTPLECLFNVEDITRTDFGRHTVFEINNLLTATKTALTDNRAIKVIIDFLKKNSECEQKSKLPIEQCQNIENTLLFLRNILHIPDEVSNVKPNFTGPTHTVQNQILWNLFSQSIDKVLIKLMTIPDSGSWGVTMVQLIALLYKDQHVTTLHKLLNVWLETSLSDSSVDNESNTSPPGRGSDDSSPMLTSDPTSDSSDTGASGKCNGDSNAMNNATDNAINNAVDNAMNNAMNSAMDKSMDNTMDKAMNNAMDSAMNAINNAMDSAMNAMNNAMDSAMNAMNNAMSNAMNNATDSARKNATDNAMNNAMNNATDNAMNNAWKNNTSISNENSNESTSQPVSDDVEYTNVENGKDDTGISNTNSSAESTTTERTSHCQTKNNEKKNTATENSDCGYGTQIENPESISTSSNEEDLPNKKPVHQKPHNSKQRATNIPRCSATTLKEKKRKKLVKRGKSNIINVQGLSHSTPTDEDISNVLKEFTVDFLLKGFNSLVKTLHDQILSNQQLEIDTSHFFWLVTYFLKFATQIELDLQHVCSVLSYEIISYITAEGVNICEQFELAIKLDGHDLKPCTRRLHLVVTAIREFVQALELYKKFTPMSNDDRETLQELQMKICETEELRSLLILLLRHYNPQYQTKQYLQDLIITNHILLIFLDGLMKTPEYKGPSIMVEHVRQFANKDIMYQYGLLLEDYDENGEFINDCVFTIMHHVGGELDSLITLFQPHIIKTFTSIWKSDFEICDDWSDLVEYVINTFVKKPTTLQKHIALGLEPECCRQRIFGKRTNVAGSSGAAQRKMSAKNKTVSSSRTSRKRWTDNEISSLNWNYMQCNALPDMIGEIVKLFKEDGITKSRESVIRELLKQCLISEDEFDKLINTEKQTEPNTLIAEDEIRNSEIWKLCEQLSRDNKSKHLFWVQKVLLETCHVKIYLSKKCISANSAKSKKGKRVVKFNLVDSKSNVLPVISPVSYHSLIFNQSVPLVPWNCEQAAMCKDLKFLQLLHRLGFHMPVDTGKLFIRIPHFWTPDFLFEVASKISPIDTSTLKFSMSDISETSVPRFDSRSRVLEPLSVEFTNDIHMTVPENFYEIHKQKPLATIVNFTPMPGSSYSCNDDTSNANWLKVVQKSQEYRLNLNLPGVLPGEEGDVVMAPAEGIKTRVIAACAARAVPLPDTALSLAGATSVTHNHTDYSVQMDSEFCNNSVCDTASMASDLTRMYVSDEDEKLEDMHAASFDI